MTDITHAGGRGPSTLRAFGEAVAVERTGWSRRHVMAAVCGGALVAAAAAAQRGLLRGGPGAAPRLVPTRGLGTWTSFGTVAVVGAERGPRAPGEAAAHGPAHEPGQSPWDEVVHVRLEVHNGLDRPVLVSPGQFRLRVGHAGPTVAPLAVGHAAGALAAGATVRTWVSYLAPASPVDTSLEYADTGLPRILRFPLAMPEHAHGQGHEHGGPSEAIA